MEDWTAQFAGLSRLSPEVRATLLAESRVAAVPKDTILFGPGTSGEPTAQDWADLVGTLHYEVVTSPRGRVVRTYREADAGGD